MLYNNNLYNSCIKVISIIYIQLALNVCTFFYNILSILHTEPLIYLFLYLKYIGKSCRSCKDYLNLSAQLYVCVCVCVRSGNAVCNSGGRCCSLWAESVWSHSSHHQHRTAADQTQGTQSHRHASVTVLIGVVWRNVCIILLLLSFSECIECSFKVAACHLCRQWWSMSCWLPTVSCHAQHAGSNGARDKARELWVTCKIVIYTTKLN